jgi:hypothetical protein
VTNKAGIELDRFPLGNRYVRLMYGYVANVRLCSDYATIKKIRYNHQIWLKSYSTIRVRLRPGLGYDQVIGYDDVRLMLGDVG